MSDAEGVGWSGWFGLSKGKHGREGKVRKVLLYVSRSVAFSLLTVSFCEGSNNFQVGVEGGREDQPHLPLNLQRMDNMDKEPHLDMGLTTGISFVQEKEEEFTFVSRKKNGRRQNGASVTTTTTPPRPVASPSSRTVSEEPKEASLPGWGTNKKPGKVKKNSQRAKMMGSRGVDQEERTLEWGQRLMDDRVMTLKQSKFYIAFQGTTTLALFSPVGSQDTLSRLDD